MRAPWQSVGKRFQKFQGINGKRVEARFDGGMVSAEAGALLVRELCEQRGIFERFSLCFSDQRNRLLITHDLQALLEQRVYGLVCGYEDSNDHDSLRVYPVFQLLIGKVPQLEPVLAGRNTLNRKEQFQLFSYRLSAGVKRANQLRLYFSAFAYLILVLVKKYALVGTALASAEVQTIRSKLIKLAARVTVSARRVYLSFAQGFPFQDLFRTSLKNLAT